MSIFIIINLEFIFLILGRVLFQKWFNHLSLYTVIWANMIVLYELKLVAFDSLSTFTWIVIFASYFSFILGIITIYIWELKINKTKNVPLSNYNLELKIYLKENEKFLRNTIYIFSLLGLYGALQHWSILLKEFGNVGNVFIHAAKVYHMKNSEEIKGVVPYIWLFSYFAAFLSGIYFAYKRKISLVIFLPIIGIILKETAKFTRNGILLGFFEFIISYLLFSNILKDNKIQDKVIKRNYIVGLSILIVFMILTASAVKLFRNPEENFAGTNKNLSQFSGNAFISPQIYFYAASQIGVLNKFLEKDEEPMRFGGSTFYSFYNFLASFGLIQKVEPKLKGYFIPTWSNTATYLRDLYNDFGISGLLIFPYLLGFFATLLWFRFYQTGNLRYHLFLTQICVIIALSFFILATRMPPVTIGILILYPIIIRLEKKQNTRPYNYSNSLK